MTVGALAVVNATGSVTVGRTSHFWAAPFELGDEFGGLGFPSPFPADAQQVRLKFRDKPRAGENTTIAVIATDAVHDARPARSGWPSRPMTVSRAPSGRRIRRSTAIWSSRWRPAAAASPLELDDAIDHYAAASATMARAIARAVYAASPAPGDLFPVWAMYGAIVHAAERKKAYPFSKRVRRRAAPWD